METVDVDRRTQTWEVDRPAYRVHFHAGTGARDRCDPCGSYRMVTGACMRCGWQDPNHVAPAPRQLTEERIAVRLAEPCVPSSDISSFMSPDDYR